MNLKNKIKGFFKKPDSEERAGLYITVIFHLTVIIVLLITQIGVLTTKDTSFLLDFSKLEEKEKIEQEEQFKENISKRLDELINAATSMSSQNIKNIAVDASAPQKDDRGTNAKELYEDAERLANDLKNGKQALYEDARNETVDISANKRKEESQKEYNGPSVISYTLDGRKASSLKIPAYRCLNGGDVTVIITVDPQGNVVNAKVYDDISAKDQCLRNYAIRAARLSKFTKSPTAPSRQQGEIVYRFIAQ